MAVFIILHYLVQVKPNPLKKSVSKLQRKDWAAQNEIEIGKIRLKKLVIMSSFFLPITSSCDIKISSVDNKLS